MAQTVRMMKIRRKELFKLVKKGEKMTSREADLLEAVINVNEKAIKVESSSYGDVANLDSDRGYVVIAEEYYKDLLGALDKYKEDNGTIHVTANTDTNSEAD